MQNHIYRFPWRCVWKLGRPEGDMLWPALQRIRNRATSTGLAVFRCIRIQLRSELDERSRDGTGAHTERERQTDILRQRLRERGECQVVYFVADGCVS